MPVFRSHLLNRIGATFGEYTCQWPSDLESSLLRYVEKHGVFHLINDGRNEEALNSVTDVVFLTVFSKHWSTVIEPLKSIRFLGVDTVRKSLISQVSQLSQSANTTLEHAESLIHLAKFFRWVGWYILGEVCAQCAAEVFVQRLGVQHETTLNAQNVLLALYVHNGKVRIAEPLGQHVLSIQQQVFGRRDARTLRAMVLLGDIYRELKEHDKGIHILTDTFSLVKKHFPVDHPLRGLIYGKLAGLYKKNGQYALAEKGAIRDVAFKKRHLGKQHPLTLTAQNQLADIYRLQNQYFDAERLYQDVLNKRVYVLGTSHPSVAVTCGGLSRLMLAQGNIVESIHWRVQDVGICLHNLGIKHEKTQMARLYLAELYVLAGQYSEAEKMYYSVFKIRQEILGLEHWKTRRIIEDLVGVLKKQNRHREELMLRMQVARDRALLYRRRNKKEYEASAWRKVLEIQEYVYGLEHERTCKTQHNLAWVLLDLEQEEAVMYFQRLQKLWTDPKDWKTLWIRLGTALMMAMKTNDTTQCALIIDQLVDLLGEEHERVLKAKERLRRLHDS